MIRLTSACNIVTGKLDSNAAIPDGKYPYFTCAPEPLRIDTYSFDTDAILLAGNNANGNFHCQRFNGKFNAYQRTYVITAKEGYDIDYIFYSLLINLQHLRRISQGSQTKFLTMSILDAFDLVNMEYEEQKRLVACLKSIDEKRKQNSSICADLEAMSKLLYDYWFVQFDFPDEKEKPYKSSGGKMVWNEQLKREIPEKWEVKKLSELAVYSEDRASASSLTQANYIGIDNLLPEMKGRTESEYTPETGNTVGFGKGDILLGNIRPYFKKIWLSDIQGGCSPDVLVIRSIAGNDAEFLFASLARDDFFTYDMAGKKGSKMPRGDKDHIMRYPIAYSKELVLQFCAMIRDWCKKISEIYYENQQLSSMRDFLLPLLMNGQVKVGE